MESCGSTSSIIPVNTSLSLSIPAMDDKLGHKSPTASNEVQEESLAPAFKCKFCPRIFQSARALGGHQKAHSKDMRVLDDQRKAHMDRRPGWFSVATALRSASHHARPLDAWDIHYDPSAWYVPLSFPRQTGTVPGGFAPAQLPSAVLADGYRGNGERGHLQRQQGVSEVNQEETANGIDLTLEL